MPDQEIPFAIPMAFSKRDDDLHVVYGWASVTKSGGEMVVDLQGDVIETAELRKAVHVFMDQHRASGVMHLKADDGSLRRTGTVVESMVVDADIAKALGMPEGKEGWFVGVHVEDEQVWKMIRAGFLKGFSIGGRGLREEIL